MLAFVSLPLSLAGGFLMMLVADAELSLGAILGLLAVVGLAARFAVLLVSTAQSLEGSEGDQDIGLVVQQAARQRLRPVVVSSAAVAGFVIPMAVLGDRPGLEILQPLALVLLGGLATTAVVTLLVLPALYGAFASPRPRSGGNAWLGRRRGPDGSSGQERSAARAMGSRPRSRPRSGPLTRRCRDDDVRLCARAGLAVGRSDSRRRPCRCA